MSLIRRFPRSQGNVGCNYVCWACSGRRQVTPYQTRYQSTETNLPRESWGISLDTAIRLAAKPTQSPNEGRTKSKAHVDIKDSVPRDGSKTVKRAAPKKGIKRAARVKEESIRRKAGYRNVAVKSKPRSKGKDKDTDPTAAGDSTKENEDEIPLWKVMQEIPKRATATEPPVNSAPPTRPLHDQSIVLRPNELRIDPVEIEQPPVPKLQYGLDRVLFNPGVYQLQDPHSRVYNFDPYLQKVMPVIEFDFNALKEYKTSSQDEMLSAIAKSQNKKYIGSTSSMTSTLAHFHYLLSDLRSINLEMLSRGFRDQLATFTRINMAPNAIFLRWKNGTYAIDADKEHDGANVLMMLGKSMEKLLTLPTAEFERYRKGNPESVPAEETEAPEAFQYTTMGDFLMRSQLDAYDPRLPGTGMFDLKTRAVVSVRMDTKDFEPMTGYEIQTLQGRYESYEREHYDMMRSTMLKYMLQARMGRMDGIFLAYHNVERIFGFQYFPVTEMDRALHGQTDRCLGDQEFRASLKLLNEVFEKATAKYPNQSLRFHFETKLENQEGVPTTVMWIFAEPVEEAEADRIQSISKAKVAAFERIAMGIDREDGDVAASDDSDTAPSDTTGVSTPDVEAQAEDDESSNSAADTNFLHSIAAPEAGQAPLFTASLTVRSKINGAECQRPAPLRPDDIWEVDYSLQEWETDHLMWGRYEAMKARRREILTNERGDDGTTDDTLEAKERKDDPYIRFLRNMSQKGREYRAKLDKQDRGLTPVVYGQDKETPVNGQDKPVYGQPSTCDVDEYMSWLYGEESKL